MDHASLRFLPLKIHPNLSNSSSDKIYCMFCPKTCSSTFLNQCTPFADLDFGHTRTDFYRLQTWWNDVKACILPQPNFKYTINNKCTSDKPVQRNCKVCTLSQSQCYCYHRKVLMHFLQSKNNFYFPKLK